MATAWTIFTFMEGVPSHFQFMFCVSGEVHDVGLVLCPALTSVGVCLRRHVYVWLWARNGETPILADIASSQQQEKTQASLIMSSH